MKMQYAHWRNAPIDVYAHTGSVQGIRCKHGLHSYTKVMLYVPAWRIKCLHLILSNGSSFWSDNINGYGSIFYSRYYLFEENSKILDKSQTNR